MITSKKALELVLDHTLSVGNEYVTLMESVGRVLAEDVTADRDFPPFDRVTMDGIAINFEAYENGTKLFSIEKIGAAGSPKLTLQDNNKCIEIMTGASLPKGTDTVIRYEDLLNTDSGYEVQIAVIKGKNVHKKGSDYPQGELILPQGQTVKPIDINLLATVGNDQVAVKKLPKVAVISSGDELVDVDQEPKEYQIRKSNSYMLAAKLKQIGIHCQLHHLMDDAARIKEEVQKILESVDVVLMSGGVSKGKFDFIPDALASIGVKKQFHKVAQRPGKPFWFGTKDQKVVFAFPGNPVSTLACFHKYFLPWFYKSMEQTYILPKVKLAENVYFKPELTYFAQAKLYQSSEAIQIATVVHGNGSGDMVHPTKMDGFLILPAGKETYRAGEVFDFMIF